MLPIEPAGDVCCGLRVMKNKLLLITRSENGLQMDLVDVHQWKFYMVGPCDVFPLFLTVVRSNIHSLQIKKTCRSTVALHNHDFDNNFNKRRTDDSTFSRACCSFLFYAEV